MKNLRLVLILIGCLALTGGNSSLVFADGSEKPMCPVMPGNRAKEKFTVEYEGKKIPLCCRSCVKKFNRNPSKYIHK